MSYSGGSEPFEIAALKKKQAAVWDPLAHGTGTPWEDRATHGTAGAFFKTCVASLTGPRRLTDQIRRPETTGDVRLFVIGCGLLWGLSAGGHVAFALYRRAHAADADQPNPLFVGVYIALAVAAATAGVYLLWMLYTAVYNRLVAQEANNVKLTEPLLGNVTGYAFGPSLLAPIPVVGPALALLFMFVSLVAVGRGGRLRLRLSAAVIDVVFGFVAMVAIASAGSFVATYVNWVLPDAVPLIDKTQQFAAEPAVH